ncbi:MAG: hypothetical protein OK454_05610 [Thaumarchaeota archaeon]|nr:hypothetical protein [Nitrososphaerota archaeon]
MSDYVTKLESFPDLEVSIIRATKINKVLKAILKLDSIPKEEEFRFKPRSQVLLDKWNKLLAVVEGPSSGAANGVNGTSGDAATAPKKEAEAANGVKKSDSAEPAAPKAEEKRTDAPAEAPAGEEKTEEKPEEKPAAEEVSSSMLSLSGQYLAGCNFSC